MSSFTGTAQLTRLILRRDRVRLPVWIVSLSALIGATALAVPGLYQTPAAIAGYARIADSAATRLLSGRPDGLDNVGAITSYEVSVTGLIAIALMMIFLVVRHTRAEEETGRSELLRAGVTGRHAGTAATMIVAAAACLLLGVLDALLMMIGGGLEAAGSLLHGAAFAATGMVFTAIAAVTAQITVSARGARGIAMAVLAVLFVVRGIGDVAANALTWFSPLGWALMSQPYGAARWWVLAPLVLLAGVLFVLAPGSATSRSSPTSTTASRRCPTASSRSPARSTPATCGPSTSTRWTSSASGASPSRPRTCASTGRATPSTSSTRPATSTSATRSAASLAACEGVVLVVDAAQGIEAQTLANCYLALENDLEIVAVPQQDRPARRRSRPLRAEIETGARHPRRRDPADLAPRPARACPSCSTPSSSASRRPRATPTPRCRR